MANVCGRRNAITQKTVNWSFNQTMSMSCVETCTYEERCLRIARHAEATESVRLATLRKLMSSCHWHLPDSWRVREVAVTYRCCPNSSSRLRNDKHDWTSTKSLNVDRQGRPPNVDQQGRPPNVGQQGRPPNMDQHGTLPNVDQQGTPPIVEQQRFPILGTWYFIGTFEKIKSQKPEITFRWNFTDIIDTWRCDL